MTPTIPPWANVSRETLQQLIAYAALLEKWNTRINLVSRETITTLWDRHIWDSFQLTELIPSTTKTLIDLGSGGGLPGIILAIALPDIRITLVERDQRKCAFLSEAARALNLANVTVLNTDVTTLTTQHDIVTARALASLIELCELAHGLLGKDSLCLFPKGKNFATEIAEARQCWSFHDQAVRSKTHPDAHILVLSQLERT